MPREDSVDAAARRFRKLMLLCKEEDLSDEERHEWSEYLLRKDVTTWSGLPDEDVRRLLDGIESHQMITVLKSLRPTTPGNGQAAEGRPIAATATTREG